MKISSKISPELQEFISTQNLFDLKNLHEGVVHIGFPQQIEKTIQSVQSLFEESGVDSKIYFVHKATKNNAFIKQAYKLGIGVDVASYNELVSALSCGFVGDRIECTGPKNDDFLRLALCHCCTINLDSLQELERLIVIYKQLQLTTTIKVLIRINNPIIEGRNIAIKPSRFGSNPNDLSQFYCIFQKNSFLRFDGFHFHAYGYDPLMRAGILANTIELIKDAFDHGFEPNTINIGGAFREKTINNYQDWSTYIEDLEQKIVTSSPLPTWGKDQFGLFLNEQGRIGGKEKAISRFYNSSMINDLQIILNSETSDGRNVNIILAENMINLVIEPGFALLQQAGISIIRIIESKTFSDGRSGIIVEGNIYNLSIANMLHYTIDPILIKQNPNQTNQKYSTFITGNLCHEDDFLVEREVEFDQVPEAGDLLVFVNTAGYYAGFEDATPIMHPISQQLVAFQKNNSWQITTPTNYNPYH